MKYWEALVKDGNDTYIYHSDVYADTEDKARAIFGACIKANFDLREVSQRNEGEPLIIAAKSFRSATYYCVRYDHISTSLSYVSFDEEIDPALFIGKTYCDLDTSVHLSHDISERFGELEKDRHTVNISDEGDETFIRFLSTLKGMWNVSRGNDLITFSDPTDAMAYSLLF